MVERFQIIFIDFLTKQALLLPDFHPSLPVRFQVFIEALEHLLSVLYLIRGAQARFAVIFSIVKVFSFPPVVLEKPLGEVYELVLKLFLQTRVATRVTV